MGKVTINLTSITYAMKGRQILERVGIFANIGRTRKNKEGLGCGYSLFVNGADVNRAVGLLKQNRIKVVSVETDGGLDR